MGRQNLGALLGNVEDKPTQRDPADMSLPTLSPAEVKSVESAATAKRAAPKPEVSARAPLASELSDRPSYLRFVRKETRLREDQQNQLTLHARRLNRAKAAGTPRITDNSLIRVAVDLLLARIDDAVGDSEAVILKSLNR